MCQPRKQGWGLHLPLKVSGSTWTLAERLGSRAPRPGLPRGHPSRAPPSPPDPGSPAALPSMFPCHPPSGAQLILIIHPCCHAIPLRVSFRPPSSAPGTSPDVSGRRAPLCSLPSSCIVGTLKRGTPRRGNLLTPSSEVPGECTDTAHQLLRNARAFHTDRRWFPSTSSVVTPALGPPLQLVTKEPMGSSIGVYGRWGWALRGMLRT